jgi:signal transduction histidine kinase
MAVVAHELGNPLHSITGHLELLLEEPDLPDRIGRPLRIISGQAERMIKTIKKLLSLTRSSEGAHEEVLLVPLLCEIVALMEPRLRAAGVEVELVAAEDSVVLWSDSDALQSLIINLLENALDSIGKNGRIWIEVAKSPEAILLHIRDSGPGIAESAKEHIFDPFFTTKSSGTGLGLSVCRKIVDDLGASIAMGEKPGGHFILIFPFDKVKAGLVSR